MDSPVDIDLCYLSATEQLRLFRSGELSPVEVLQAQLARVAAVEPIINAFTDTFEDEAMQAARSAEAVYTNNPEDARPLEGLTVTIKDEMDVKGQRNTEGSLIYKDRVATADHPVAERLQRGWRHLSRPVSNARVLQRVGYHITTSWHNAQSVEHRALTIRFIGRIGSSASRRHDHTCDRL